MSRSSQVDLSGLADALATLRISDDTENVRRITTAKRVTPALETALRERLAEAMLSLQKTPETATKVGLWMSSHIAVVMHDCDVLPSDVTPVVVCDGKAARIHLPMRADNLSELFLKATEEALDRELEESPDLSGGEVLTGSQSRDEGAKRFTHGTGGRRELYDPRAKVLAEGKAHTEGALIRWGLMRQGLNEDREQSSGCRWLWEQAHNYLLSKEAWENKSAHRWFRDMCVINGISTVQLEGWTGIPQATWSAAAQLGRWNPAKYINRALSIVSPIPTRVGRHKGYEIPPGSVFGLKAIEHNGNLVVDPEQLEEILSFYVPPNVPVQEILPPDPHVIRTNARHELRRLERISEAYVTGAVTRQELSCDQKNHCRYRTYIQHEVLSNLLRGTKGYKKRADLDTRKISFYLNGYIIDATAITNGMKAINSDVWHFTEEEIEKYCRAVRLLPSGTSATATFSPEEAWEFAIHHHDGYLATLLRVYGEETKIPRKVANTQAVRTRPRVQEEYRRHYIALVEHVFSQKSPGTHANPWNLPCGADQNIRRDVEDYIRNFHKHYRLPAPASFWLTDEMALDEFIDVQDPEKIRYLGVLRKAISTEVARHPNEKRFHLVSLGGAEVLVKETAPNEYALLESDVMKRQALFRNWLHKTMGDPELQMLPASVHAHAGQVLRL